MKPCCDACHTLKIYDYLLRFRILRVKERGMTDKIILMEKAKLQLRSLQVVSLFVSLSVFAFLTACSSKSNGPLEGRRSKATVVSGQTNGGALGSADADNAAPPPKQIAAGVVTSNMGTPASGGKIADASRELLAIFRNGVGRDSAKQVAADKGLIVKKRYAALSALTGQEFVLLTPSAEKLADDTGSLKHALASDPRVKAVSLNHEGSIIATPNDEEYYYLWGMHNTSQVVGATADADIDAPEAWDIGTGSSDVIIAVLDTGIDYLHEDLIDNMWVNEAEFSGVAGVDDDGNGYVDDIHGIDPAGDDGSTPDADPMDTYGHGTHCAGTIGAVGDNSIGVVGVNWDVRLMGLKMSPDFQGSIVSSAVIESIDYVVDQVENYSQNVVAINASWKVEPNSVLRAALEAAGDVGIMVVAGAGNDSTDNDAEPVYPASYDLENLIAVAATDYDDRLASFSNWGANSVHLAAPGVLIMSTVPRKYLAETGDIFFDDMESGDGNWVTGGTGDTWAITTDHEAFSAPSGGLRFLSDSPGVDYGVNVNSWVAIDHNVDLTAYTNQDVYLGAATAFQIEELPYDMVYVELSNNGGVSWDVLTYFAGATDWTNVSWRIPERYKTAQFRFRFHMETDFYTQYMGWLLDDVGIGTTAVSAYDFLDGTSMAAPHVTGTVGLMAAAFPFESIAQRRVRILDNVDTLGFLSGRCTSEGRLNVFRSITADTTCENDGDCDDGLYCNGVESCNLPSGKCMLGTPPCDADDGVFCNGEEGCDETADACLAAKPPCPADDGLFCNGEEGCNELADECLAAVPPCDADDGLFCNGEEGCDEGADACLIATPPCDENDGLFCNGQEGCDETAGECLEATPPCESDDGLFCNGEEGCNETADACLAAIPPCETDDGIFCNGIETCDESGDECTHSGNPCAETASCNETMDHCAGDCTGCGIGDTCYMDGDSNPLNSCEICVTAIGLSAWTVLGDNSSCDDGNSCTDDDVCVSGQCQGDSVRDWTSCGDSSQSACFDGECESLPKGDTCANPIELALNTTFDGDFSGNHAFLDVEDSCGQGPLSGVDALFEVRLTGGRTYEVTVVPETDADLAVSVLRDCDGDCVDAIDEQSGGGEETVASLSVDEDGAVLIQVLDVNATEASNARYSVTVREIDDGESGQTGDDSDSGATDDTERGDDDDSGGSAVVDSGDDTDSSTDGAGESDDASSQSGCGCRTAGGKPFGTHSFFNLIAALF